MNVEAEGGPADQPAKNPNREGSVRGTSRRKHLSLSQYIEGIQSADRSILAKAITLVESSHPADYDLAAEILDACLKTSGDAIVVGVSGIPGAGKSSLIEALGQHITVDLKENVAVLAIDPSSRISGGSILGDKTRMSYLMTSDKAFIRPSPSRGRLGGVAAHTRDTIVLCKAACFRNIFIETVGVGQSETTVRDMVDFLLLVAIAGAGDELQGIKRGLTEMADAVVVNKADGDNIPQAEKARSEAESALRLLPSSASGWMPPALTCSARTGLGVKEIWSAILEHHRIVSGNGYLERIRREQNQSWMRESLERGLVQLFESSPVVRQRLPEIEQEVARGKKTPIAAARQLLILYDSDRVHRSS